MGSAVKEKIDTWTSPAHLLFKVQVIVHVYSKKNKSTPKRVKYETVRLSKTKQQETAGEGKLNKMQQLQETVRP